MTKKELKRANKIARQEQFTAIMSQMTKRDLITNFLLSLLINLVTSSVIVLLFILLARSTTDADATSSSEFYRSISIGILVAFAISLAYFAIKNNASRTGSIGAKYLYWVQVVTHAVVIICFGIASIIFLWL